MYIGIDVSKDRLDVHIRPTGEAFSVTRDEAGLGELVTRLGAVGPVLIVLEATGGFETIVATTLAAEGFAAGGDQSTADPRLRPGLRTTGENRCAGRSDHCALR